MSGGWRALGAAVAFAATAGLVAFSGIALQVAPDDVAWLRLSWRAKAPRVERCREPSPEELASVPAHMRQREICEGALASFRLTVQVDGEPRVDRELRPAGAREDRPTYVLENLPLVPGAHRVAVRFAVVDADQPAPLELEARIEPRARDVVLVTTESDGTLVLRASLPSADPKQR